MPIDITKDVQTLISDALAPLKIVQADQNKRLRALEASAGQSPVPDPVEPPPPDPEPPAPVPDPDPPAPPLEQPEARIRRLIAETWAQAGAVNALPDGAMPGWIAHFLPRLDREDEDLRDEMLEIGLLDGVLVLPEESPGPGPVPNPAPAPSPGGMVLTVDQMIDHMAGVADVALKGVNPVYGWRTRGYNYQGANPDFRHTPAWFGGKSLGVGKFLLPWHVVFEGDGNAGRAGTFRHMASALLFLRNGEWVVADISIGAPGGSYQSQDGNYVGEGLGRPVWRGDTMDLRPGVNFHGYTKRVPLPPSFDAVQVQVAVQGPADGEWAIHVSGDYYLAATGAQQVVPGFAISRPVRLTGARQILTATSLVDAGVQEPGSGITSAQLRANPPPIVV